MQISLKAARVNADLTQSQVEAATGFARSTLTRWENGKGFPRIDDLTTLCELYEIPVEFIKDDQTGRSSRRRKHENNIGR